MYAIRLSGGDWLEMRGGYDWGRTSRYGRTVWTDRDACRRFARHVGGKMVRVKA